MSQETVYFQVRLSFPDTASIDAWRDAHLLSQRDHLRDVRGFDGIDMGDDDLLGSEMTVTDETTLEGALAYLDSVGLPIGDERIVAWEAVTEDGADAVWFAEAGPLPRASTVADLLAFLDGEQDGLIAAEVVETDREEDVHLYGRVADYDAFRAYRLPLIFAGMAGARLGATGTVSFIGDTDGEFVTLYVDFLADRIDIREPDPQNLTEAGLTERFNGVPGDVLFSETEIVG